jgi:hypothetical protein
MDPTLCRRLCRFYVHVMRKADDQHVQVQLQQVAPVLACLPSILCRQATRPVQLQVRDAR